MTMRALSLVGRDAEVARAWAALTAPGGGAVVLEGEAGVGKTAVLNALVRRCESDHIVACAYAVEAEADLSYATFADLADPLYDLAGGSLPEAQRAAIDAALLRGPDGERIELRAVATAFRTLLRTAGGDRPVLLVIDDVHWLDPASAAAIGYALRRLGDERCRLLASVRLGHSAHLLDRLRGTSPVVSLPLAGLSLEHTRAMLTEAVGHPLSSITAARIHALSEGNPLLSLELARAQGDGRHDPVGVPVVPHKLDHLHAARVRALPARVRRLLLHVAAHGRPSLAALQRALPSSTLDADLNKAAAAGVLSVGDEVRFTHPLIGATAYGAATDAERRRAHRAWAAVVDGAEERARHLAKSSAGRSGTTAASCETGAREARARGSMVAAAELAALSQRLTPLRRREDRARRGRLAVELVFAAGDLPGARTLIEQLNVDTAEPAERSRLKTLEGRILVFERDREERAAGLHSALASSGGDALASAEAHIELASLSMSGSGSNVRHARMAVRILERLPGEERALARALSELANARRIYEAEFDFPTVERAELLERRYGRDSVYDGVDLLRAVMEGDMGLYDSALHRLHALVADCEERGELIVLPELHAHLSGVYWCAGRLEQTREHGDRAWRLGKQLGQEYIGALGRLTVLLALVAQGVNHSSVRRLEEEIAVLAGSPTSWSWIPVHAILGHVALTRCRWDEAVSHLDAAADASDRAGRKIWAFRFEGDHVEALFAAGDRRAAWQRMDKLTWQAERPHAIWPAAVAHRCRALLLAADGRTSEARAEVREARAGAERLSPFDVGRCLLVEGAVERRAKQKRAARAAFSAAHEVFEELGAHAWAERAAGEGQRVGGRAPSRDELTATERRVVDLAADGLRNREIAAALFISEHTVESNLTRAYRKLGVRSRTQLPRSVTAGR